MLKKNFLNLIICSLCLFVGVEIKAQKFTLSGSVKDEKTGEELIGATVLVQNLQGVGINANEYGFYSLTLQKGNYTLKTSYVG